MSPRRPGRRSPRSRRCANSRDTRRGRPPRLASTPTTPPLAASTLEAELITAQAAAAERRERASGELDLAVALAASAGLARRVTMLAEQLRAGTLMPGHLESAAARSGQRLARRPSPPPRRCFATCTRAAAEPSALAVTSATRRHASRRRWRATAACEQQLDEARAGAHRGIRTLALGAHRTRIGRPGGRRGIRAGAWLAQPAAPALSAVVERARADRRRRASRHWRRHVGSRGSRRRDRDRDRTPRQRARRRTAGRRTGCGLIAPTAMALRCGG